MSTLPSILCCIPLTNKSAEDLATLHKSFPRCGLTCVATTDGVRRHAGLQDVLHLGRVLNPISCLSTRSLPKPPFFSHLLSYHARVIKCKVFLLGSLEAALSLIRDVLWEVWNPRDVFFPGGPFLIWFPLLFLSEAQA